MKVYIEDLATQPEEIQKKLQQAVEAAQPKDIGKDGLLRLIVQGIVYIVRLVLTGKLKVFKVERCEKVKPTATAAAASATVESASAIKKAKAVRKPAPKKTATATKRAKRSE